MNKENRKQLELVQNKLDDATAILEELQSGEQDKFDNLSEGLQESERGQKFQENADQLSEATSAVEDAKESIQSAIDSLSNIE